MAKTQLNKEYFEKKFGAIDKRFEGIDRRFEGVDKRFDDLDKDLTAVKVVMKSHDDELKALIKREVEELARITNKGFEDVIKRLDVRERVERLERDMSKVRETLHL